MTAVTKKRLTLALMTSTVVLTTPLSASGNKNLVHCHTAASNIDLNRSLDGGFELQIDEADSMIDGSFMRGAPSEVAFKLASAWSAIALQLKTPVSQLCKFTLEQSLGGGINQYRCIIPAGSKIVLSVDETTKVDVPLEGGAALLSTNTFYGGSTYVELHLITKDGKGISLRRNTFPARCVIAY